MNIRRIPGTKQRDDYPRLWAALQSCSRDDRRTPGFSLVIGVRNEKSQVSFAVDAHSEDEFHSILQCLEQLGFSRESAQGVEGFEVVVGETRAIALRSVPPG